MAVSMDSGFQLINDDDYIIYYIYGFRNGDFQGKAKASQQE